MNGLILKTADIDRIIAHNAKVQAVRNALQMGLAGAGMGVGARGLQGLLNQWHRAFKPTQTVRRPSVIDMPVPAEENDEKFATEKQGEGEIKRLLGAPGRAIKSWAGGGGATDAGDVPFGLIPGILLGTGGAAAGWKGLDYLLDRSRENELETQEERAKKEYEAALLAQSKVGQALQVELDSLYEKLEETQRDNIEKVASWPAFLTNAYGLYAMLTGIPASVWAYEATKARQRSTLLESARKRYRRTRESTRPTPVFARPAPMPAGNTMKSAPDEEELEGSPLDKAAGRGLVLSFVR